MFPYDPTLLATVQPGVQTMADVLRMLRTIDAVCIDTDGLKWFNWEYLQVTEAVAVRVAANGFSDTAWLARLDVEFARFYFAALKSSLAGQATPACWQALFTRRNQIAAARIQFALAGINAHINHDLPAAIVATCQVTGTIPVHGSVQYNDYTSVNATLDSLIESAKRTMNLRLPGDALPPFSHVEDTVAAFKVSTARELAWHNAEHLWRLSAMPGAAAGFMNMLDGFTTVIGKTLMVPVA